MNDATFDKDEETENVIKEFNIDGVKVIKIFKEKHGNMYDSYRKGFDLLVEKECKYLCCLDSDTIVSKNWIDKLKETFNLVDGEHKIITGFNSNRTHNTIFETDKYRIKKTIGGVNMFFSVETYKNIIRDCLVHLEWDFMVCEKDVLIVSTKPSVVQHIGEEGLWSNKEAGYDYSNDFINLKEKSLIN